MNNIPIRIVVALFMLSASLTGCQSKSDKSPTIETLTKAGVEAVGPYFTKDNQGRPVLCWTEKSPQDSLYSLKYAIYNTETNQFNDAVSVAGSEGSSTAPESMSKVAFKSDGTIVAIFNKPFKDAKSRFASAIYYTLSSDDGHSWTSPQFIHSETSTHYGRSFFSIATLADGEVGAIWLDGRFGDAEKGSALFFSRTENGEGFGENTCLDKNTCECCRTAMLTDPKGGIHIAYRGIQFPFGQLGKQVRDMVYSFSTDNGASFTPARAIGNDNWQIEGCPHTGPTLAHVEDGVSALWFTGAGIPGLYFSTLKDDHQEFSKKNEISPSGKHPQMVAFKDEAIAIVWDEAVKKDQVEEKEPAMPNHEHMHMDNAHASSSLSNIIFTLLKEGKVDRQFPISDGSTTAHHPVIESLNNGVLVVWVNEKAGSPAIAYSFIEIN